MHPIYEYMVGDTVRVVRFNSDRIFCADVKKPFIIKEAMQILITRCLSGIKVWEIENNYRGFIENLESYFIDEDELYTTRMVLIEKNKLFANGK